MDFFKTPAEELPEFDKLLVVIYIGDVLFGCRRRDVLYYIDGEPFFNKYWEIYRPIRVDIIDGKRIAKNDNIILMEEKILRDTEFGIDTISHWHLLPEFRDFRPEKSIRYREK